MKTSTYLLIFSLFLTFVISKILTQEDPFPFPSNFDRNFLWGTATSAYQIEGAHDKDGRTDSIWDVFVRIPGKIKNGDTGNVTTDHYNKFKEDIELMKQLGVKAYRFSISWSRILPKAVKGSEVNPKGIEFYNNLINELKAAGIEPVVTLYHWDLPQVLVEKYGGWLNETIVEDFNYFAKTCFDNFRERVYYWITINEPWVIATNGYYYGTDAPGRCSDRARCDAGDSLTENYIVGHNLLKAHARAVKTFRDSRAKGRLGMALNSDWAEPRDSNSYQDYQASEKYLEFMMGWFAEPIYKGDYPESMRIIVGSRLPSFTAEEKELIKGSADFFALNHYTSRFIEENTTPNDLRPGYERDRGVNIHTTNRNGVPIGKQLSPDWLIQVPSGMYRILRYIQDEYNDPIIFITENGCAEDDNPLKPIDQRLNDTQRIEYYSKYLESVYNATSFNKVKVQGYFAWSLLDNFEWANGFSARFGLYFVDFKSDAKTRHLKDSVKWFSKGLSKYQPHFMQIYGNLFAQGALLVISVLIIIGVPAVILVDFIFKKLRKHDTKEAVVYDEA